MPRQNACKTHRRRCIHTSSAQLRQQCLLAASRISSAETGPQGQDGWGGVEAEGEVGARIVRHTSGVTAPKSIYRLWILKGAKKKKRRPRLAVRSPSVVLIHVCWVQQQRERQRGKKRCVDVLCKWWWQWGGAAKHASTSSRPVARC